MDLDIFENIWNYFLVLEEDLLATGRFVEPTPEQKDVYSLEFYKIFVLSCCEFESVAKLICKEVASSHPRELISDYKDVIVSKFPLITSVAVKISRTREEIVPFKDWETSNLHWWTNHNKTKHHRNNKFALACYYETVMALSGLYVAILYLGTLCNFDLHKRKSKYITSKYAGNALYPSDDSVLPDFE